MKNIVLLTLLMVSLCYAQEAKRTAVAVTDLRGSGISDTDAKFLTDRLVIELQNTDVFDVMERDKVKEILKEQGFQQSGACDNAACLVEMGRLLPVEKMIGGSVGKIGDVYSIQVRMIDLKTAKVERSAVKDFNEKIEYLLTNGMASVANVLAGNEKTAIKEEGKSIVTKRDGKDDSYATVVKVEYKVSTDKYERLMNKTKGNKVFINKGISEGISNNTPLLILRANKEKSILDPNSNQYLKQVVDTIAELVVRKVDDKYSECSIIKVNAEIVVGDKVYIKDTAQKNQ